MIRVISGLAGTVFLFVSFFVRPLPAIWIASFIFMGLLFCIMSLALSQVGLPEEETAEAEIPYATPREDFVLKGATFQDMKNGGIKVTTKEGPVFFVYPQGPDKYYVQQVTHNEVPIDSPVTGDRDTVINYVKGKLPK